MAECPRFGNVHMPALQRTWASLNGALHQLGRTDRCRRDGDGSAAALDTMTMAANSDTKCRCTIVLPRAAYSRVANAVVTG
jgi:hypothetical protein